MRNNLFTFTTTSLSPNIFYISPLFINHFLAFAPPPWRIFFRNMLLEDKLYK